MTSAISGTSSQTTSGTSQPQTSTTGIDALANKNTFLQLLVSQIKNQDPLNPSDGVQFVSQLAQFSELEQMMQIRSDVASIATSVAPAATDTTGTGAASGSN
jgi:flagellar basal-body rod modification protein FlgD